MTRVSFRPVKILVSQRSLFQLQNVSIHCQISGLKACLEFGSRQSFFKEKNRVSLKISLVVWVPLRLGLGLRFQDKHLLFFEDWVSIDVQVSVQNQLPFGSRFQFQLRSSTLYRYDLALHNPAPHYPTLHNPALHNSACKQLGPQTIWPLNNPAYKQSGPAQFNPRFL